MFKFDDKNIMRKVKTTKKKYHTKDDSTNKAYIVHLQNKRQMLH